MLISNIFFFNFFFLIYFVDIKCICQFFQASAYISTERMREECLLQKNDVLVKCKSLLPKRRVSPPSPLAHYIPAQFPHHFSNDSSAKGNIVRFRPLVFFSFFLNIELLSHSANNLLKLRLEKFSTRRVFFGEGRDRGGRSVKGC